MTSRIHRISVDSKDPYGQSLFWSQVVNYREDPGNPNHPTDPCGLLVAESAGPGLIFERAVPEGEATHPVGMHLDLVPVDLTQDEEIERLLKLGATMVSDHRDHQGRDRWAVLADQEGNSFCVLLSDSERNF